MRGRADGGGQPAPRRGGGGGGGLHGRGAAARVARGRVREPYRPGRQRAPREWPRDERSEEHTSELQSHSDLVCRLLLEKKKKKRKADRAEAGAGGELATLREVWHYAMDRHFNALPQ